MHAPEHTVRWMSPIVRQVTKNNYFLFSGLARISIKHKNIGKSGVKCMQFSISGSPSATGFMPPVLSTYPIFHPSETLRHFFQLVLDGLQSFLTPGSGII